MTADTVDNFLDVSVDFFVKVNMESFREVVDMLGGALPRTVRSLSL